MTEEAHGDDTMRQHRLKSTIDLCTKLDLSRAIDIDNKATIVAVTLIQAAVAVAAGNFTYTTGISASDYGYFRDVNLMIFFGFGFLMTFLHRHGLSAIGYCLVISALVVELSLVVEYLFHKGEHEKIEDRYAVSIVHLMDGLFCAAAVMISYGAVIGKVTPFQLVVMGVVEVFAFWANFRICVIENEAHDVGGGMMIHTFGAYFGLAATWWVTYLQPATKGNSEEKSIYSSDIFSLAGTIILWCLWPSFQSAVAGSEQNQIRAITNTFFSLCSSTLAFCVFSRLLNNKKFDVVHMQNATLAGGVVMGVAGDMDLGIHGAMLAGFASGAVSCFGYSQILPLLLKINIHDTCGVNNLHGMPGIMSAIVGIIAAAKLDNGTPDKQVIALFVTMSMSIGCGLLAGFLMTVPLRALGIKVPDEELFNDRLFFGEAEDYEDAVSHLHDQEKTAVSHLHDQEKPASPLKQYEAEHQAVDKGDELCYV